MITGGVAAVNYRDPRLTRDVDLVLELHRDRITTLLSTFDADAFYLPPAESLVEEAGRPEGGGSGWAAATPVPDPEHLDHPWTRRRDVGDR